MLHFGMTLIEILAVCVHYCKFTLVTACCRTCALRDSGVSIAQSHCNQMFNEHFMCSKCFESCIRECGSRGLICRDDLGNGAAPIQTYELKS